MTRATAAAVVIVLSFAASAAADEDAPERHAFVETSAPRVSYFVEEPIRLRVRVGYDAAWFAAHAAPTFRRPMTIPVQVDAPWWNALPGTKRVADPPVRDDAGARPTFALGDDVVAATRAADVSRDGRTYAVVEIERAFLPTSAGTLTVPPAQLRFTYAEKFDDDAVEDRVASGARAVTLAGAPLSLEVHALPTEGRPADFTGAVGRFTVTADAAPRELTVGQSIKLTLRIEGDGNLAAFDAPIWRGPSRFHLLGTLDARGPLVRVVTYDLAPLSDAVDRIDSVSFAYFDPTPPATYRTVTTEPIALTVHPAPDASPTKADESGPSRPDESRGGSTWIVVGVAGGLLVAVLAIISRRRARPIAGPDAAAEFRARVDADAAGAFTQYLAARIACAPAVVVGDDVAGRLAAVGVPADLASRSASLVERLVAARYGGVASSTDAADARVLVDAIESSLEGDRRAGDESANARRRT